MLATFCNGKSTEWNRGWRLLLFIAIFSILFQRGLNSKVVLKNEEVCIWQRFNADCDENEVIIVNSARYGRIKTGNCCTMEVGEQPCFTDAQPFVDKLCGGKRQCELSLPNRFLDLIPSSCSTQRVSYLEISYYCQQVYSAAEQTCNASRPISVTSPMGYLANIITDTTDKGSSSCPWKIQLQPEQSLNLTLIDFGVYGRTSIPDRDSHCLMYAVLRDSLSSADWSGNLVCGGDARETLLLPPMAKEVQIEVKKLNVQPNDTVYFLIRFEVVGCSEFVAPDDSLADKISNGYRITCKDSSLGSWNVHCVAGKWTPTQNISCATSLQRTTLQDGSNMPHLPQGLMIVIVMAVAIVISTIIIVIGIFLLQKRKSYSPPESLLDSPGLDKHGNLVYYTMGKRCLVSGAPNRPMTDFERDYATTLQMRQMVLPSAVMLPECVPSPGDVWMCPVHGVRTVGIGPGNGSLSRRNIGACRPKMEHIYELPTTICEAEVSIPQLSDETLNPSSPFYHELDPNLPLFPNRSRNAADDLEPSASSPLATAASDNSGT